MLHHAHGIHNITSHAWLEVTCQRAPRRWSQQYVVFICTGKHPVGLCQLRGYNRLLSNTAVFLCFYDPACNGNNRLLAYLKNSCFSRRWGCRTDDRLPRVKSLLHIGKTSLSNGASSLGNSCRNSLCGRNGAVLSLNLDKTRNLNTIRQVILINVCVNSIYTWICKMTQKHRAWRRRQAASYSPNTP